MVEKMERDYLDGKKHGKGKEYSSVDGKVIFDGAYFYNYRIAGKEYNNESHLIQEGEYCSI